MDEQRLEEMYRLVKENNRMLHAARRNAFVGGIIKMIVWAAFVLIPIWFSLKYIAPALQPALQAVQQMQTAGGQAQVQLTGAQDALKKLQEQLGAFMPKK